MRSTWKIAGAASLAAFVAPWGSSQQAGPGPAEHALVDKYCVTCHNAKSKTGNLVLAGLDVNHPESSPEVWEKVVRKVRAGMMPPAER